jgi:hypothetical protein
MARKRRRGGNRNRASRNRSNRRGRDRGNAFWGDPDRLPDPITDMKLADEPAAVVHSLGPPPLQGREAIAEHYFTLVYDRITMVSGAVAGAAGMIEVEDLIEQLEDDWDDSDDDESDDGDDDATW